MSTEQPEDDWDTVVETRDPRSTGSKLDAFGWGLLRWWGILFRTVFISLVGIIGYFWLDPQSIGDVPFAELTLNQIFRNLFALLIAGGCISWFFNFPEQGSSKNAEGNPYVS